MGTKKRQGKEAKPQPLALAVSEDLLRRTFPLCFALCYALNAERCALKCRASASRNAQTSSVTECAGAKSETALSVVREYSFRGVATKEPSASRYATAVL